MMLLSELCQKCDATLLREARVTSLGFVEIELGGRLVFAMNSENLRRASSSPGISAILTTAELAHSIPDTGLGIAVAADPRRAFVTLHNKLVEKGVFYGQDAPSALDPTAIIHPKAHVDTHGEIGRAHV